MGTVDSPNFTSYLGKLEQAINLYVVHIYSNKKEKSDFYGTVSFDPDMMSQQKINQHLYQTADTDKMVII